MKHPVVITVLFHPEDKIGTAVADRFIRHFDKLGMARGGINVRIPVRFRSESYYADGMFLPISGEADLLDVAVLLYSPEMAMDDTPWKTLCLDAQAEFSRTGKNFMPFVVQTDASASPPNELSRLLHVNFDRWSGHSDEEHATRLLINLVNSIRRKIGQWPTGYREVIFISHAKRDGRTAAERIVRHISDPTGGLKLNTFYDALELEYGEDWIAGLKHHATTGSLIALVSDTYDERPWCNQEILWAKEHRRPILMVDIGRSRVERSFPYGGNAPLLRDPLETTAAIEFILLELLSEALRCDLFLKVAGALPNVFPLPRPPELLDLAYLIGQAAGRTLVYPDPQISTVESDLLKLMTPHGQRICALGEL